MTQDQLDDIIEDIMTSTWDSGKTKILNFARLMCDKQKEICSIEAETTTARGMWDEYNIVNEKSILKASYPDELQGNN